MDPQEMIKLTKKGKPVMLFTGVRGQPDRARTEEVSRFWAQSLQNAHIQVSLMCQGAQCEHKPVLLCVCVCVFKVHQYHKPRLH